MVFDTFPNFTNSMYDGNEPCGKGQEYVDGGYCDRWTTRFGGGESYKGYLIHANFSLNQKITIYIVGDVLWIVDFRHFGKSDVWEYTSDPSKSHMTNITPSRIHTLESEKIEKILNTDIDCAFWRMVQSRSKEIYRRCEYE